MAEALTGSFELYAGEFTKPQVSVEALALMLAEGVADWGKQYVEMPQLEDLIDLAYVANLEEDPLLARAFLQLKENRALRFQIQVQANEILRVNRNRKEAIEQLLAVFELALLAMIEKGQLE